MIVLSLSPHNLHLLFRCILSVLALTYLVLMALFCAAIWRDSISLLRFPFLCHVHVFLREMLLIYHLKCPYNCFSCYFCFLVIFVLLMFMLSVLFLLGVLRLSFSCNLLVIISMHRYYLECWWYPFPPSFLDTYSLSMSSLGC